MIMKRKEEITNIGSRHFFDGMEDSVSMERRRNNFLKRKLCRCSKKSLRSFFISSLVAVAGIFGSVRSYLKDSLGQDLTLMSNT